MSSFILIHHFTLLS